MDRRTARNIAYAAVSIVLAAVLVSAWAAAVRHGREQAYRTASVCLDYEQFAPVAAQWPEGSASYWREAARAGATSVAVGELTLGWMEDAEFIEIRALPASGADIGHLVVPLEGRAAEVIRENLPARLGAMAKAQPGGVQVYGLSKDQLKAMNAGPDIYAIEVVRSAGLEVVLRLSAFGGFGTDWIEGALAGHIEPGTVVIFSEKQVGGFPNRLESVASGLLSEGALIGQVEFAKQLGSDELCSLMAPSIAKVHSITPEELAKGMELEVAVDRFARAVRERNMRLLYVHPFRFSGEDSDITSYNLEYIGEIAAAVEGSGFSLGPIPVPDRAGPDAKLLLSATALGASAALYLILSLLSTALALAASTASAALLLAVSLASPAGLAPVIVPLAAAVIMPCLGATAWISAMRAFKGRPLVRALAAWAGASAVTVAGGLMLSSPVADTARMLGVGVFTGVKLAQLLPLVIAFAGFWALLVSRKGGRGLLGEVAGLGMQPVRWWHAAVVGAAGAIGLYMILRSGNSSPALVSGVEAAARQALEKILVFRPRSKEIFVGHPAMIAAGLLLVDGFNGLALAAFSLGMVGQVSMANTFMHLHTPIAATLIRTALGLALGLAVGLLVAIVYRTLVRAARRRWPGR